MGPFVIACYRPRPGKEQDLLRLVKEHVPALRRQGLASQRPTTVLRAADGTLLEIFEWSNAQSAERAHTDAVVLALWDRFGQACEYAPLSSLKEAARPFPHFEAVDI